MHYAAVPDGGVLALLGLGPVGQFATRIGRHLGYRIVGVDPVAERRELADRHGIQTIDPGRVDDVPAAPVDMTAGYGPEAGIDAVGMEVHGRPERRPANLLKADPAPDVSVRCEGVDR